MRNRIEQALQQMPASFAPYLRELVWPRISMPLSLPSSISSF